MERDLIVERTRAGLRAAKLAARDNPNPEVITALMKVGAVPKAKDSCNKMTIDYAEYNQNLKGTDAYRKLNDLSY